MKKCKTILVVLSVLALALLFSSAEAQLLKKLIKTGGGGDTDVVDLISNIPDDAHILFSINFENLAKTELLDMAKEQIGEDLAVLEQVGIDIKKDIKHIIFGITLEEQPEFYGVIAGTFDKKKIIGFIEEQAGEDLEEIKVGGKTVYAIEDMYLTFNKTGLLFAGSEDEGKDPIKKMLNAGDDNLANSKSMVSLVKDTDTAATAWGVVLIPDHLREKMAEGSNGEAFDPEALRKVNFSFDYSEKITLKAGIYFSEAGEAASLAKFVKEKLGEFQDMEGPPAEMKNIMGKLKISTDGNVTRFSLSMKSDDLISGLQNMMGMFGMRQPIEGGDDAE